MAVRQLPAVAAAALIGAVVIAGIASGLGGGGGDGQDADATTTSAAPSSTTATTAAAATTPAAPTTAAETRTTLSQPLGMGSVGTSVQNLQDRLKELGFEPGPADGSFGLLTQQAVWAFEKLVLGVPRGEPTGVVTDEMWQRMQDADLRIEPRRRASEGRTTTNHTEVYLPEQVVVFFVDDEPALISHMSSGDGEEYREMVTIDPGEARNENGDEPIQLKLLGVAFTPGGVYSYDRFVEGRRQSALGGMYDPAYFNYGIAIHGALDIPLHPASHGCIRLPMYIGERFQEYVAKGDQVFVFDGEQEPEAYGDQLPIFDRIDPEWAASTTTTTEAPETTTRPPTTAPAETRPQPTQPQQTQPPPTQAPRTNPPTTPAPTEPATTAPTTTTVPETTTTVAPPTP